MPDESDLPLLNVFEVETDEGMKHLIGFLDPVLAGAKGIATRSVVGGFVPDADGEFDARTFRANPEFLAAFTDFMNDEPSRSDEVVAQALTIPSQWLYIVDPRDETPDDRDPPASQIVGCYAVDDSGQVVPNSFQYNAEHVWFCPETGVSGLLDDRRFFDWLNKQS
jgi:hypothetical protein